MLNTDKELKLYYSIGEVADMFWSQSVIAPFFGKRNFRKSLLRQREEEYVSTAKKT